MRRARMIVTIDIAVDDDRYDPVDMVKQAEKNDEFWRLLEGEDITVTYHEIRSIKEE